MKTMGYILLAVGLILAFVGIKMIMSTPDQSKEIAEEKTEISEPSVAPSAIDNNEQKGLDFEKWVIAHFPKQYYTLKEWRGDKYDNGTYAESTRYPDLELELNLKSGIQETFAIECKWRSNFKNDKIEWASEESIKIYNQFASDRGVAVFVVIGIGGEPSTPETVYAVPLRALKYPTVTRDYLEKFRRKDTNKDFFYKAKDNSLE